jgi:gliding motility associated protien GldN
MRNLVGMKNIQKITLFAVVLLTFGFTELFAQGSTSVSPANTGDKRFKVDTTFSVRPIRDDDKMFQMQVWRRIDLREKYNQPLYGSGDTKRDGIINNIYKAIVEENALEVFADEEFTTPLSISEFQENFWLNALGDSIFVKNMYFLDFREDFLFDKHHSQIKFDVKFIELVMPSVTNANAGQKSVGFIRFKDFYNYFKDHPNAKWINFQNVSKSLSYDKAFDLRLFRSVVRKYSNSENALIADLIDPSSPNVELQAYLKSLEFEYKLLDFENSLWEW